LCLRSSLITSSFPLYMRIRTLSRSSTPSSFSCSAASHGVSKYRLRIKYSPPFSFAYLSCSIAALRRRESSS